MSGSSDNQASPTAESYWPKRPGRSLAYWVLRYLLELAVRCLYLVKLEGRQNLPRRGGAVLAANHLSAFDPVFVAICLRRRITALANARYFSGKNGWFFRGMGQIPLEPGDDASKGLALACASEVLAQGGLIGIFPEGSRSLDGDLHRGRLGVASLAQTTGRPVIPIGIIGSYDIYPKGRKWPRLWRRVVIRVGQPIWPAPATSQRDFTNLVMKRIQGLSGQRYVDSYTDSRPKSS